MKRNTGMLCLLLAPAVFAAPAANKATVRLSGKAYTVIAPASHRNLSVYLITGASRDNRAYITLDEGLKSGVVKVTEKTQKQVSELVITNLSGKPLFLQEGDRLVGGEQDRIVPSSMVVPPKTSKLELPAMCVEAGRWSAGATGSAFGAPASPSLAPREVRVAAKVEASQSRVWENVAKAKRAANAVAAAPMATTSLSETMDSGAIAKATDAAVKALGGLAKGRTDAVGVAFAVNGIVEEANVYPNHGLLVKLYPRLLRSYAMEAATAPKKIAKTPAPAAVAKMMATGGTSVRKQALPAGNSLGVYRTRSSVQMETVYDGSAVHQQFMRQEPAAPQGKAPVVPQVQQRRVR